MYNDSRNRNPSTTMNINGERMSTMTRGRRPSGSPRRPPFSFNLDVALVDVIDRLGEEQDRSRNWMVTTLLVQALQQLGRWPLAGTPPETP